jgi:hypothetical protein
LIWGYRVISWIPVSTRVWKSVLGIMRDSQWKGWSIIGELNVFAKLAGRVAAGAGTAGRFVTGIGLRADFTAGQIRDCGVIVVYRGLELD